MRFGLYSVVTMLLVAVASCLLAPSFSSGADPERLQLQSESIRITAVTCSPDGSCVLALGADAKLHSVQLTGRKAAVVAECGKSGFSLTFSRDGKVAAVGVTRFLGDFKPHGCIRLYDVSS